MKSTLQFFLETKRYEVTRLWSIFTLSVLQLIPFKMKQRKQSDWILMKISQSVAKRWQSEESTDCGYEIPSLD